MLNEEVAKPRRLIVRVAPSQETVMTRFLGCVENPRYSRTLVVVAGSTICRADSGKIPPFFPVNRSSGTFQETNASFNNQRDIPQLARQLTKKSIPGSGIVPISTIAERIPSKPPSLSQTVEIVMAKSSLPPDRLALTLTFASVILGVLIWMVGNIFDQNFVMHGYVTFVGLSVAAIVLGIVTRSSPLGKTAAITSSVLLVGSVGFLT